MLSLFLNSIRVKLVGRSDGLLKSSIIIINNACIYMVVPITEYNTYWKMDLLYILLHEIIESRFYFLPSEMY